QQGMLSAAINKRLRKGIAATRPGKQLPDLFNLPAFSDVFLGSAIYHNRNGDGVMLIACREDTAAWALADGIDPVRVPLPPTLNLGIGRVEFVQAFDKVLLVRHDSSLKPLAWDGACIGGIAFGDDHGPRRANTA